MEAIFLDRDGVINRERSDYVKSWQEFEFLPGSLDALELLAQLDLPIVVITNQSVIGRGIVDRRVVDDIHDKMLSRVNSHGGRIDRVFVCPHHPNAGCECRKPRPGLLFQAQAVFHLDLSKCVFVGDSVTDFLAARAVGCRSILVQSGRQGARLDDLVPDGSPPLIVPDLMAAAKTIAANVNSIDPSAVTRPESNR
jgi:D-glycero-D-manno-heptose 1,7-bisphosphate phosphatase